MDRSRYATMATFLRVRRTAQIGKGWRDILGDLRHGSDPHGVARSQAASVREAISEVMRTTEGAFSSSF